MPKSAAGTRRAPSALAGDGLFSSREAPFSIGPPPGGAFHGSFPALENTEGRSTRKNARFMTFFQSLVVV